ncbi:transposase, partial [Streptomyces sp. NPDC057611]|uniref:transposase n=1 Tax=Streptomyces sp. NPDC057611 TaxID=3346182 RepID=UPI00367F446E
MLAARDLLPAEHFLDPGYPSAELIVAVKGNFGVALVTPVLLNSSPQARAGAGFDRTAFTIDWDKRQSVCPRGSTSTWWSPASQRGTPAIVVKFDMQTCQACPVRNQCTRSRTGGRSLSLQPRERQEALDQARAEQTSEQWQHQVRHPLRRRRHHPPCDTKAHDTSEHTEWRFDVEGVVPDQCPG